MAITHHARGRALPRNMGMWPLQDSWSKRKTFPQEVWKQLHISGWVCDVNDAQDGLSVSVKYLHTTGQQSHLYTKAANCTEILDLTYKPVCIMQHCVNPLRG